MKCSFFSSAPLCDCKISMITFILRLTVSGAMLTHGIDNVKDFGTLSTIFPDPLGVGSSASLVLASVAEIGCSVLLFFGLFTRFALLLLMITMAMALFFVSGGASFAVRELPLLYLSVYVSIFALGAGGLSIDRLLFMPRLRK